MLVWSLCLLKYYLSIHPLSITAPPALRAADGDAVSPSCVQAQAGLYVGQEAAVHTHTYGQFGLNNMPLVHVFGQRVLKYYNAPLLWRKAFRPPGPDTSVALHLPPNCILLV